MEPFRPTAPEAGGPSPAGRARTVLLAGVCLLTLALGVASFLRASRRCPVEVPILMYHRIAEGGDSPWAVTCRDFEEHLQALREQGYTSILPSDLVAHQRWGWPLPAKPVILTFDDGYESILRNAEPILARQGFRGVCYLISGLVASSVRERRCYEETPLLTWPEVRAMHARGTVVFGGHSRTHANLRALADPSAEIAGCDRDLRRKGRLVPEGFCYPFGQFKEATLSVMRTSVFTTAMTCEDGFARCAPGLDLLTLPRVAVMGGQHGFSVEWQEHGAGLEVRVRKTGRVLEVCPRLAWEECGETGARHTCRSGWLPGVSLGEAGVTLPLPPCPEGRVRRDLRLELWDQYHLIRYGSFFRGKGADHG